MADEPNSKHPFIYSTHAGELEAPKANMKVSEIKTIIAQNVPGFNAGDTLVLEERGDQPDKPLNDGDEVKIHHVPHFYSQPPANFGS